VFRRITIGPWTMAACSTPFPDRTVGGGAGGTGGGTAGSECDAAGGEAAGAGGGEADGVGDGEADGVGDGSGDSARLGVESAAGDETTADTRRHGHDAGRAAVAESPLASGARPLTLRGADGEWNSGGGH
jgi:hypothetical protein